MKFIKHSVKYILCIYPVTSRRQAMICTFMQVNRKHQSDQNVIQKHLWSSRKSVKKFLLNKVIFYNGRNISLFLTLLSTTSVRQKKALKSAKIVPGYFAPWFTFTSWAIINLMIDSKLKHRCQNQNCISLLNSELDKTIF